MSSIRKILARLCAMASLAAIILGMQLSGVVVLSLLPATAEASFGQCRWEGGPGAPTHPSCEQEDCIGEGGFAECLSPIPKRWTNEPADSDLWSYAVADPHFPFHEIKICEAWGHQWTATGCSGSIYGANEQAAIATATAFLQPLWPNHNPTLAADLGWAATGGATGPFEYFRGSASPQVTAFTEYLPVPHGSLMLADGKILRYSTSNPEFVITIKIGRSRNFECPAGTTQRANQSQLRQECVRTQSACVKVGNPVSPATGEKTQKETDYRVGRSGGLEFARYFTSRGFPLATRHANSQATIRDYYGWRHSYQRILFPVTNNPGLMAIVEREDCSRHYFAADGREITNVDGAAEHLTFTAGVGYELRRANADKETYDLTGRLTSIVSRAGETTTLSYDGNGLLSSVSDAYGHQFGIAYNSNRQLSLVTTPETTVISYEYDSAGNLQQVTYPDTYHRTYHYEDTRNRHLLTGITDESGSRFATYTYDNFGRMLSEHHANAERYDFTVSSSLYSASSSVVDPLNQSRSYGFTAVKGAMRLTSSDGCPSCGLPRSAAYDGNGNPSSRTDYNGNVTTYTYDGVRNLELSRTEASGTASSRTITTQWHPTYRLPVTVTEPGRTRTQTYDGNGNLLTVTVTDTATGNSRTRTYTYNAMGQLLTADGPRTDVSDVTTYTYYSCTTGYECGQTHTVTDAAGHVTTYNTYNPSGYPLSIIDPNGVVETLTYDLRQRLTSRTVGGEQTTYEYWPTGLLKKVTLPDNSSLAYTYDAAHRLTQISDGEGNRTVYTLDAMGNRTTEQVYDAADVLTRTRTRVFNALNQLWKEIGAAGTADVTTVYGYDDSGNQTEINAPLGRNTVLAYDELHRLTEVTDPANRVVRYDYDDNDNLVDVTDPRNLQTSYEHSGFGDITRETSPDQGIIVTTYNSAGNVATITDARGRTAAYRYDALNRIVQATYNDQTINHVYDVGANAAGRLSSITDASGSTSWTYTAHGRIASKTQTMNGVTRVIGYGYNGSGQLVSRTTPSGQLIGYEYLHGRVSGITVNGATVVNEILYAPLGATRGWRWGNGAYTVREYDQDGRVIDNNSAGFSSYTYYPDGLIQTVTQEGPDTMGPPGVTALTSASTNNRLASATGSLNRSYSYDAAGNVLGDGVYTFSYNDAGRMVTSASAGNQTLYTYNAMGQRVKKSNASGAVYFVYDESGRLLGEYGASGELIQEIVWFEAIPIASIRLVGSGPQTEVFYIHTDHLNAPAKMSAPSTDAIVWRWDHDPFGNGVPNEDPDGNGLSLRFNLRFPGQYFDSETGLHYNYLRDAYDSATGRYTQSDPIGLNGGVNTYAYASGNPVGGVDPLGLDWIRYDGQNVQWFGGEVGDSSTMLSKCAATSGYRDFFRDFQRAWMRGAEYGPVADGLWRIDLRPDPTRIARILPNGQNLYGHPDGGIETVKSKYLLSNGMEADTGTAWGSWRARLRPIRVPRYQSGNYYLHDSSKGFTHGCVETCTELLDELLKYRELGNSHIDVLIDYRYPVTNGRPDQ